MKLSTMAYSCGWLSKDCGSRCYWVCGRRLLRLLLAHPQVEIGAVTANANAGTLLGQHHPQLTPIGNRVVAETSSDVLTDRDVVFLALPHGASGDVAAQLHPDTLVIDCGADFRLSEAELLAEVLPVASRRYLAVRAA